MFVVEGEKVSPFSPRSSSRKDSRRRFFLLRTNAGLHRRPPAQRGTRPGLRDVGSRASAGTRQLPIWMKAQDGLPSRPFG